MTTQQDSVSAKSAGPFNLVIAARFRELLKLVPSLRLKTSVMVVIGILSGLMEMVGITFLVSLVFVLGQQSPSTGAAIPGQRPQMADSSRRPWR